LCGTEQQYNLNTGRQQDWQATRLAGNKTGRQQDWQATRLLLHTFEGDKGRSVTEVRPIPVAAQFKA